MSTDPNTDPKPPRSLAFTLLLLLGIVLSGAIGVGAAYLLHRSGLWTQNARQSGHDYRRTPPELVKYTEKNAFFCDITASTSFAATENGEFFIGGRVAKTPDGLDVEGVQCFSSQGKLLETWTLHDTPLAMAFGQEGQIFAGKLVVAFPDRLVVYSRDSKEEMSWNWPEHDVNSDATAANIGCLVLTDQEIFASDDVTCRIYRFDSTGKLLGSFGGRKTETTFQAATDAATDFEGFAIFLAPIRMAFSPTTGLLYVSNPGYHRIEVFTTDGYWESSLSWENASSDVAGFCGCCNPVSLACLPDGRIVTAEKEIHRVKVYKSDGQLDCVVAGPEILDSPPRDLPLSDLTLPRPTAPDMVSPSLFVQDRNFFVAALPDNAVLVFDPLTRLVRSFQLR